MSVKIRLARRGAKKRPFYWIVAADSRCPRDGRFIEKLGTYDPMVPKDHENRLRLVEDRVKHWLSVGAKPTDRVERFFGAEGLMPKPVVRENPKKSLPKKKAQERVKEKEEKAQAAKEAAEAAEAAAKEAAEAEKAAAKEAAAAPAPEEKPAEAPAEAPAETKAEEKPAEDK